MENQILFSIIIPTYNRSEKVLEVIDSILNQAYKNFEIIVIDDGSLDNTGQIIKEKYSSFKNINYHWQTNAERGAARNNGLARSKGDYVNFFDSDDFMCPNHLSSAIEMISTLKSPEIFALSFECQLPDKTLLYRRIYPDNLNKTLIEGNHLSCNSVFIRRDIALQQKFNEDRALSVFEDWELWLRILARHKIHVSKTVTSIIINHEERSVFVVNKEKLITRGELLYKYLKNDPVVLNTYKNNFYKLRSSIYSYISLHLALSKKYRGQTIIYFIKAFFTNPKFIFNRRFYSILKHII